MSQETKDFMLLCWLQDAGQEDQEQVQVAWLGAELRVTWREAQFKAEMAESRRRIWEDSHSQGAAGTVRSWLQ